MSLGHLKTFFSYSWKYRSSDVRKLADFFKFQKHFEVTIDTSDYEIGRNLEARAQGINGVDVVLVFLCKDYFSSDHCKHELEYARQHGKTLVPVRLHDVEMTEQLKWLDSILQLRDWIDFPDQCDDFPKLFTQLAEHVEFVVSEVGSFTVVDAPFYSKFYQRHNCDEKERIKSKIHSMCLRLQANTSDETSEILVLTGQNGVGKTYFVSNLVHNSTNWSFFVQQCGVLAAVWLNCYQWRDESKFVEKEINIFKTSIQELLSRLNNLAATKPILVFDDVFHVGVMTCIKDVCTTNRLPCICICDSLAVANMKAANSSWSQLASVIDEISPMSNAEIGKMLTSKYGLLNRLSDSELRNAADGCGGLPRVAADFSRTFLAEISNGHSNNENLSPLSKDRMGLEKERTVIASFVRRVADRRAGVHSAGMALQVPDLTLVDVPKLDSHYFSRLIEEDAVRKGIRAVSATPEEGFFVVSGGGGIGKSTLVSHVVRDHTFVPYFQGKCNIQIVIWLNCFEWRAGIANDKQAQKDFIKKLLNLCYQADQNLEPDSITTLDQMAAYFQTKGQRILFILDDVFSASVLDVVRKNYPHVICLAITQDPYWIERNSFFRPFLKCQDVLNPYMVGQLSDHRIVEILQTDFKMKDRLTEYQLFELAQRSCGMPLLVSLIGGQFRTSKHPDKKYREMETERLGKFEIGKTSGRGDYTAAQLFRTAFHYLGNDIKQCFYTFLLFNPVEPVEFEDVAFLWNCADLQVAKERCDQLERMCLIRHTEKFGKRTGNFYLIHQILHEIAVDTAMHDFKISGKEHRDSGLSRLRIRLIIERQRDVEGDDAAKMTHFRIDALNQQKKHLVDRILENIKSNAFQYLAAALFFQEDEQVPAICAPE